MQKEITMATAPDPYEGTAMTDDEYAYAQSDGIDPYEGTAMTDDEYVYAQSDGIDPYEGTAMTDDEYPYDPTIVAAEQAYAKQRNITALERGDWRFKVRLSPTSDYLYNAPNPGILAPLRFTDGVIFPYTPQITVPHNAEYSTYNLTHSNYRGTFYQGSRTGDIVVNGTFTAQDTAEANYMLAVIHFFKSATKMFYGQDQRRGTPPPMLFLTGFGDYQFNEHACVLSSFNYTLPDGVDYVRAYANPNANPEFKSKRESGSGYESWDSRISRMLLSWLFDDEVIAGSNDIGITGVGPSGFETYVPTKLNVQLMFIPVETRKRVSKEFSLKDYANGSLIKRGFW
jgi:hypothetical protein